MKILIYFFAKTFGFKNLIFSTMIILSNISKAYGPKTLFSDVSLRLLRGEKLGLVGPNGAGKTTLFSIILGELEEDSGKVELERGKTIGFLPQESAPTGEETVIELATAISTELSEIQKKYDFTRIRKILQEFRHWKNLQNTMVLHLRLRQRKFYPVLLSSRMIFKSQQRP